MKRFFFTLNDFSIDGGSTVRMYGILNALIDSNSTDEIYLISNAKSYHMFNPKIKHIYLGVDFTRVEKRVLQVFLSILPYTIVYKLFSNKIEQIYNKLRFLREEDIHYLIFFTYLDNSLAYLLFKKERIPYYINDIHGIAPIEFKYKAYEGLKNKIIQWFKYYFAKALDKKVFKFGKGFIFVSEEMKKYFISEYKFLNNKELYIVKDGINKKISSFKIDNELKEEILKDNNISKDEKVILFIGRFKNLGGVIDLIEAFNIVSKTISDCKLMLVGDGEDYNEAIKRVKKYNLENRISFIGPIPYYQLFTFHDLAHLLVCPDKNHPYSHMVPHIKYFDALVSNKPVINGKFRSLDEINRNEQLSVNFEPSNIENLAEKIIYSLNNLDTLSQKYKNNRQKVYNSFTYNNHIKDII